MTRQFLAIGECMVEMAPRADGACTLGFAGDTFNTAWYARRVAGSWLDVACLTAFGDDPPATRLREFMASAGIRPIGPVRAGAGRSRLLAALRDARRAGVTAAFDPNLRPRLWPDGETMRDGIMRGAAVADVALPSFEDEATHFGDREPAATAARYPATGAGLVVVTNGAGPVHVTGPGGTTDLPVAATEVVDTTAAGDSFNARFCAERLSTSPCRTA